MHGQTKYTKQNTHLDYVNPDAPKNGALKMAGIGTFDTLNPFAIKGQAPQNMNLVYDRLMRRVWDEPFTMYPLIAKSYTTAPDRSWIRFWIDERAKFHDGTPITVDDVEFSFETLRDHGRPNMRRIYKLVKSVNITDDRRTITFMFGDGYDRETVMILAMMPILSQKYWSSREFDSTTTEIPLLNGPYRIKEIETGRKITYERVPDYWAADLFANKGQYNFKTITYDYYRDDTIALESFKKGDLNLRREWDINKWRSAYGAMNANNVKREATHQRPERAHGFIFNLRRPPFDDINVRKALILAFDDKWISKNIFHRQFKRIQSYYPNSALAAAPIVMDEESKLLEPWKEKGVLAALQNGFFPSYVPRSSAKPPTARLKLMQADMILQHNGWIIENGKRIHKDTKRPLEFELIASTPQEEKIALSYQKNLQRLGITMHIRTLDSASFQERKKSYDYDMISFYWQNSLSPGTEQMLYWSCKAAKEPARFNYSGICNPALDHFAQGIANAQTYDVLTAYAHNIDRILMSENIMIPLFYKGVDYIAHHKNIAYPTTNPAYGVVLESWWMKN